MLKKYFMFSFVLCFISSLTLAQRDAGTRKKSKDKSITQVGLGWNFSDFNFEALESIINLNNQVYNTNINSVEPLNGPSFSLTSYGNLGGGARRFLFNLRYTGRISKTNFDNPTQEQDFNMSLHTASLGFGTLPVQTTNFDIGLGISADFGLFNMALDKAGVGITRLEQNFVIGASVFMPIFISFGREQNFGLAIRPYYQHIFQEVGFEKLAQETLPLELIQEASFSSKPSNFGVELQLVIAFRKILSRKM